MVRALADGENRHRLEDADGRDIGWIVQRAIGFRGFGSEEGAMRATVDSWRALEAALQREYAGRPRREIVPEQLRLVHDGTGEWISDGRIPLARLLRLPDDSSGGGAFGIELQLPTYASEGVTIAAAQVVARALRDHLAPTSVDERAEVLS